MTLSGEEHEELRRASLRVRGAILNTVFHAGSGHIGSALSQTDVLVLLYRRYLAITPSRATDPDRDRFVLSKGHGGLGHAAVLSEIGFFPEAELRRFGEPGQPLGMHLDHGKVPGVEVSTGSLGHGLGMALGIALGARVLGRSFRTFCLVSDGELYEGSTWEAILAAPRLLGRGAQLVLVVDRNRLTMDGGTEDELPLEPLARKFEAFGWRALTCDGHDFQALVAAFDEALSRGSPCAVICETVKGKGVSFLEGRAEWHYGALDSSMLARALRMVRGERE